MMSGDQELAIADRIDGLKQPFEHGLLVGQEEAETRFLEAVRSGRLHHAWLLSGPRGCGKATFAFRMARFFVEHEDNLQNLSSEDLDNVASPDHPTFGKVVSGAHPNVLHLRIPYDEKTKKFKTELSVDEVRRSVGFFGSTAGTKGWRVAIVDTANDMNANAANALLKILEEPPEKTVFFLLADQTSRLLPTLRSRCQQLRLKPLEDEDLIKALKNAADDAGFEAEALKQHQTIINGSVRRAFHFMTHDAGSLLNDFTALINQIPEYDMQRLHRFADTVSARGAEDKFAFFIEFIENYLAENVRKPDSAIPLVSWTEVWDKVQMRLADEERLNLDRKQTVLALFHDLRI